MPIRHSFHSNHSTVQKMLSVPRVHHPAHSITPTMLLLPILLLLLLPSEVASYSFLPSLRKLHTPTKTIPTFQTSSSSNKNNNNNKCDLAMKVSKNKSKTSSIKGSSISTLNAHRKKTAGRRGTKNFVDPTKLFVGNIPFQAKEADLLDWFEVNLGTTENIESLKVIRDWKTGDSKGYGFVNFMDPICATSAMELLKGRRLMGRALKLSQGQKKKEENVLFVKKREKKEEKEVDQESVVIDAALDEAEDDTIVPSAAASLEEYDDMDDALLFLDDDEDYDDDDEEFEYDGIFEEMYKVEYEPLSEEDANKPMNREQKREALKRRKKKKLPHKGFG